MKTQIRVTLLVLVMFVTACGSTHTAELKAQSGEYVVRVENPIIEFCERLHPEIMYPDELYREQQITSCMKLCSETDACNIELPTNLPTQVPIN